MCNLFRAIVLFLTAGVLSSTSVSHTLASNGLRTIALSGDTVPGMGTDATFERFTSRITGVAINNYGEAAIVATVAGPGIDNTNSLGLFVDTGGSLKLVARKGDIAPGTDGQAKFSNFLWRNPHLNDSGHLMFSSHLDSSRTGIFRANASHEISLVALEGNLSPGIDPGVFFKRPGPPAFNSNSEVAFQVDLRVGGPYSSGIFADTGGSGLLPVARYRRSPLRLFRFNDPVLNDHGQIAFLGEIKNLDGTETGEFGIFKNQRNGDSTLVAGPGDTAPVPHINAEFTSFDTPAINNNGQTAFVGIFTSENSDDSNDSGLFIQGEDNSLRLIVREGDAAPGTPADVSFSDLAGRFVPAINSKGDVAFRHQLRGSDIDFSNNDAIFSEGEGNGLKLIAREGDSLPFMDNGVKFASIGNPVLNGSGQIAFAGSITGPALGDSTQRSIFAQNLAGDLMLVVREGEQIDVSDNPSKPDLRTISDLNFAAGQFGEGSGNEDGRPSGFNELGQLAFWAEFTDGTSGIFVSNLVAVPEPSSLALLALGMLATRRHFR